MIWLLPLPAPFPDSKLDGRHTGRLKKRDNFLTGEGGGGGEGGAKSYDVEKALSSIIHQLLSACKCWFFSMMAYSTEKGKEDKILRGLAISLKW
jgi:hypothetical protein